MIKRALGDLVPLKAALEERPWLTERHLRELVAQRRITHYKVGRKLLFDLAEIDALVERVEAV